MSTKNKLWSQVGLDYTDLTLESQKQQQKSLGDGGSGTTDGSDGGDGGVVCAIRR